MNSVFLETFEKNKVEVNQYFDFLRFIDTSILEGNAYSQQTNPIFPTLKGNAYLILYNLIEGTVSAAINEIFVSLNQDNLPFSDLTDTYKKLWLHYKSKCFEIAKTENNAKNKFQLPNGIEYLLYNLEKFHIIPFYLKDKNGNSKKTEHYDAYLHTLDIDDISGNLDIRTIKSLSEKYGFNGVKNEIFLFLKGESSFIPIPCADAKIPFSEYLDSNTKPFTYQVLSGFNNTNTWILPDEEDIANIRVANLIFLQIKEKRNKLAHGNETFSEAGLIAVTELYDMKEIVHAYLTELVQNIDAFIANKGYKNNNNL